MKVKKPQSKRKSTRLEKGISKKVTAHNRKQKKLAKKDVTWKSRKPKDPGIPNSYPFKAQLLEEIEQKKLKDIEDKQARREAMRQAARNQGATEADIQQLDQALDVQDNQNRLGALMESAQAAADAYEGVDEDEDMDEDDEDEEPVSQELAESFEQIRSDTSRKAFDKYFKSVIDNCDVIIYVLDARNPNGYRSKQVERLVLTHPNKKLIFALNKIDLVPTENLKEWIKYLSQSFPTIPLVSTASAANAKTWSHSGLDSTATKLLDNLKKWAANSNLKRAVTVGVVGYPNVGKSSIINALLGTRHGASRAPCPTGANAGVTTDIRRVKVDNKLMVLDSPGIVFPTSVSKGKSPVEEHARLTLLNAIPTNRLGECRPAVVKLVKRLRKDPQQLELFTQYYDLPGLVDDPEMYITQLLVHISRKLGRLGKGGVPNLDAAALAIVMDWRDGRISGWSEPPKEAKKESNIQVVSEWSNELNLDDMLSSFM